MPRLRCDTRIQRPKTDIIDRVVDLRNRVAWLKNVEYCLLDDQTDQLTEIKAERYDTELFNDDLRKQLKPSRRKTNANSLDPNVSTVDDMECIEAKRNRGMKDHNQLLFIQRCLLDRLQALRRQTHDKPLIKHTLQDSHLVTSRIREIQDRLTSVKWINKTLTTCKQHLQCDLDLLGKELPNVQKDIEQKLHQRILLKKDFMDIVTENKKRLKAYQQLLNHTESQSRQRRTIHEQAMASVAEQLEDQSQVQKMVVNEMTSSFAFRKYNGSIEPTIDLSRRKSTMMTNDEIAEVRCMYDQFYNIIMAGFPINISNSEQLKTFTKEISTKAVAMLTMTNRMMEEKEQLNQQIHRTNKLFTLIEMSMDRKNDTRHQIVDTMIAQRRKLELFFSNDTIEEQNRIIRQINDFILVLSKALCEYSGTPFDIEPPLDFITRLQYISDLVAKAVKTSITESTDEDDRQASPFIRHSGGEESSQVLKDSRSVDRSISSSLSSVSSRIKRSAMKTTIY